MHMKKSVLGVAISAMITAPATVSADIIKMFFDGLFTLSDSEGVALINPDSTNGANFGFRTDITGTATFNTHTGAGSATIDNFSFLGGGFVETNNMVFQAIGDGLNGTGSLMAVQMDFNWLNNNNPATAILDAAGFFSSIGYIGDTWTVDASSTANAISSTEDYFTSSPSGAPFTGVVGAAPIAMTTFNTAGMTLASIFPLSSDGISGSPMDATALFSGFNANFDFMSITATNIGDVPIPAAAWLFGSGLIALVGSARLRRKVGEK